MEISLEGPQKLKMIMWIKDKQSKQAQQGSYDSNLEEKRQ
jgi:hypothetical protein